MKIVSVAPWGVIVADKVWRGEFGMPMSSGTKELPLSKFLTAGQKAKIAQNPSYRQKAYAQIQKRLKSQIVRK